MILIEPYRPEHMRTLEIQEAQSGFLSFAADEEYCRALADAGPAFSAIQDGKTIAIGGCVEKHPSVATAWAVLSKTDGRSFVKVHRAVARYFQVAPWRRIEAIVDHEFSAGHRWMPLLGFRHEGLMVAYTPDGRDCDLYARIR